MANINGIDSYGADLYEKKGNLLLPKEHLVERSATSSATSSATFTEALKDRFANLSTATNPNVAPLNNVAPEATANPNMIKIVKKHRVGSGRNEKFYIFDENGNKYEVRRGQYNKLKPGNTVNNSQFKKIGTTNLPSVVQTRELVAQQANTPVENTPAKGKQSRAERLMKLRNNPELKARYDRMANFKKMKGLKKAGKWGAIVALAISAGALLLNKCSNDKKAAAPVEPTTPAEPEKPTTPVTPAPVEPDESTEPTEPEKPTTPVTPSPDKETENVTINAVKGDDYWKYAKMELIAEHQGDVNYKPTNAEINTRMKEIMARTNIGMAKDNVHSDPLLMVNDEVQLNEQAAKLRNEAIKQLKEEHKNQDNYKPTYSEVNKKFKEIVAKAQAEKAAA